ncbi:triphosphoribosyl-dephospho-CoA synthetase [Thiohalobacter thiocyanaticus]|uniref:Triphosphoribosyl-dephospho-CoA synthetase n=1 Tax=Thiohalobacter thiocyanaticus TaxID=585455 RepID=A0A1Z4VRT7_9GAMM|nr:hypothetical protein [Thiohalobacter thiocyanaticus]BAZ94203.1 triphosphoribosyl-dephospho-CoA synthetase [Thiohalobacter thiocyanaticus]
MMPKQIRREGGSVNYLLLFVIILMAVVIGNLASDWIELKWVEHQTAQAISAFNDEINDAAQEQRQRNLRLQHQTQEERKRSPTGVKLERVCTDWMRADEEYDSYTTQTGREKHCTNYRKFIQSGIIPRSK